MTLRLGKININVRSFSIFISLFLYKAILDIIYVSYISKKWLFMGFINSHNIYNYSLSWIILIVMSPLILNNLIYKNASSLFISLFNFMAFIPNITLIGLYDYYDYTYIILFFIYWFLLNILNLVIPSFKIIKVRDQHNLVYKVIVFLTVTIIIFISYKYTGFRIDLNIFNAYSYRDEAIGYNLSSILDYLFSISRNILPVLIIDKLVKNKKIQALLLFFVGFLAYSVTGSKSVLFSYFIVYIGYWFYKSERIRYISILLVIMMLISIIEILFTGKSYIIDVFVRRVFFIPGLLTFYYYDFFKVNPVDYFRQGIVGRLGVKSPYIFQIPQIIGDNYFLGAYANAGLFSDAYSNLGTIGVFIMPIIITLTLKLIDLVSLDLDDRIVFAASITCVFSLLNSSYFTALITHGLLATIIILYFINTNDYKDSDNNLYTKKKNYNI